MYPGEWRCIMAIDESQRDGLLREGLEYKPLLASWNLRFPVCDGFRREMFIWLYFQTFFFLKKQPSHFPITLKYYKETSLQLPEDYPEIRGTKALMREVVKPQWVEKNAVFQVFYSVSDLIDWDNFDARWP